MNRLENEKEKPGLTKEDRNQPGRISNQVDGSYTSNKQDDVDLRSYISLLKDKNELIVISKKVSKEFQLAAIVSKFDKKQAVLFTNIKDSKFKVISNLLGTRQRFFYGIQSSLDNMDFSSLGTIGKEHFPKEILSDAPFYNNSSKDLFDLPIITHFEKDAGPFVTSSVVYARDGEKDYQNSSTHRLLLLNSKEMVIRMVEGRHLHKCFTYAKEHNEDLKINVVIGVHPALNIAAAYQASYGTDEISIANYLLGGKLKLVKNQYSNLAIPRHSEIVIEGKILHDKFSEEWMVEMLRTYDFKRKQPILEISRIWYRDDPIYYDILPAYSEHRLLMGLPVEAKILGQVKNTVPSTRAVHLTEGGSNWLNCVIQIKKRLEGEPKNAIIAAFAAHPSLKNAIVVDEDINPDNATEVEYATSTRVQADRDLIIINNSKGSSLDPSSDQINLLTTKLGIDATVSLLKDKERFEIANIPGADKIDISQFMDHQAIDTEDSRQVNR
jgi:2,5-furandicarboxylate decarboxylase 1